MDSQDAIKIRDIMNHFRVLKINVKLIESAQKSNRYLLKPRAIIVDNISKKQYIVRDINMYRFLRNELFEFKSLTASKSKENGIAR